MMANQPEAFVRAKPRKISITETYRYKAEVSDYIHMPFVEAEGEIKIEFVYDGELRDFRWKLRAFWDGLLDKWELLKWLKNSSRRFFGRRPLVWITRWLGLRWLWDKIGRTVLGNWKDEKFFGVAAIADAERYGDACRTARVGHLALRGYRKPNFEEDWPENKTIELEIPVDGLKQNLAQSQKYELSCHYLLREPKSPLIRLSDVTLTDEISNQRGSRIWLEQVDNYFEDLHSKYDEILQLKIELVTDHRQPDVNADGQVRRELVERWWQEGKKKEQEEQEDNQEQQEDGEQEKHPIREQVSCLQPSPEISTLARELENFAFGRGGYLLIPFDTSDDFEEVREHLLKAAFSCKRFVPIFEPYRYTFDEQPVAIVPVPMVSRYQPTYRPIHLRVVSKFEPATDIPSVTVDMAKTEELPRILSAFANSSGGKVFLKPNQTVDATALVNTILRAFWSCKPPFNLLDKEIDIRLERTGDWIIEVQRSPSKVYSVDGSVYKWGAGETVKLSIDDKYKLIRERCLLDYPLIETPPVIDYAHLKWPCFDVREPNGVRYDPQKQALKWSEEIRFRQTPDHRFELNLPLTINRPVELYRQSEIKGQICIDFKEQQLSGLEVDYFDALGEQRPRLREKSPLIEKKSKIELEFDIALDSIFRRRQFTTSRKLEFEGVKPNRDRLEAIQGMLGDIGLEEIIVAPANEEVSNWTIFRDNDLMEYVRDPVKYIMENGGYLIKGYKPAYLWITVHVEGQLSNISRVRKEGDRTDRMRIKTGRMGITINGTIKGGASQELSVLLNHLQQLLEERFNCLRFQVT